MIKRELMGILKECLLSGVSPANKCVLVLLLMIIHVQQAFCQQSFAYKAVLAKVDSAGFYQLPLSLDLLSKSKANLADFRVYDAKGEAIPYLLKSGDDVVKTALVSLPILSKTVLEDKKMHVRVQNTGRAISSLVLQVQNTYASRSVNINGSNNGKEWFIIRDNVIVSAAGNDSSGYDFFTVEIPVSRVPYFDISFNEKDLLPVNILGAGTSTIDRSAAMYDTIRSSVIKQTDSSNKRSYVTVHWGGAYPVENMRLLVTAPKYFRRQVAIGNGQHVQDRYVLQSDSSEWLPVDAQVQQLSLEVLNEDNPPLRIAAAEAIIKKYALYAWLEKDKTYTLFIGDSLAKSPSYDLVYFEKLAHRNAPVILPGAIESNNIQQVKTPVAKSNNLFVWLALIAALVVLLLITFRFAREIKKSDV